MARNKGKRILMLDELTWGPEITAKYMREKLKVKVDHVVNVDEARGYLEGGYNYGLALIEPFQIRSHSHATRKNLEELKELMTTMKNKKGIYVAVYSDQSLEEIRKDYGLVIGKNFNEYFSKKVGRDTPAKIVALWEKIKA